MTQAATKLGTSFDGVLLLMNSIIRLAFMVVAVCVILRRITVSVCEYHVRD